MDRIRDLTDASGGDEVLSSTSGGLLDAQYLSEEPRTHLEDHERPQYVLRNKKAGVEVADGPTGDGLNPDSDYQTLAVVTDCRVLFLVGQASGDTVESVPLDDIVEVSAESSGFMKSTLVIETIDGTVWRFQCRGDVSGVAEFVDDAVQTWANARRLTDEASDQIEASREYLEDGAFTDARKVLSDVSAKVSTAQDRVAAVGPGAPQALENRSGLLIDRLRQLEQEIAATKGAHHHAAAQDAWKTDHDFERAAGEYERAAEEYERALDADGNVPTDEALQLRLKGVVKEREVLRAAPMADARAAREVAMVTDNPDEAAAEWETALTCYREAVTLDWGERERTFITDRDRAEERAVEATAEALDAHVAAGEEWMGAGDKIVRNERQRESRQAYERAEDHYERACDIARELAPDRVDPLEEQLTELRQRKSGEVVPAAETDDRTLSVEAVADELTDEEPTAATEAASAGDNPDERETAETSETGTEAPDATGDAATPEAETDAVGTPKAAATADAKAESTSEPTDQTETSPTATAADDETDEVPKPAITTVSGRGAADESPATDPTPAIQRVERDDSDHGESIKSVEDEAVAGSEPVDEKTVAEEIPEPEVPDGDQGEDGEWGSVHQTPGESVGDGQSVAEQETVVDSGGDGEPGADDAGSDEQTAPGANDAIPEQVTDDEPSVEAITEALRGLDESALTELVADVWERRGWETTVFSATTKAVYDIVALREGDEEERLLLWAAHRPGGGALGATVLRRCATTRDSSQGADSATLVTTGTLTSAAGDRAEELDVTVVDCEALAEAVIDAGLTDELLA